MRPLKDCQFNCPRCDQVNQANRDNCINCGREVSFKEKTMHGFRKINIKYL